MPVYNKDMYIKKTICSILEQSYQYFELIIINDGSTDNSLSVIQAFSDKRIRLYTKSNSGVSDARNYGIEKAQYSYIAFCDADDEWMPNHLMHIIQLAQKYPNAGLLSTGRSCYQNKEKINDIYFPHIDHRMFIIKDLCSCMDKIITSSICIKKEAIQQVGGFKSQIKNGEDLDVWIKIASLYTVAYYNAVSIKYIVNSINNAGQHIDKCFPFWEWYQYNYTPKQSLKIYTGRKIIGLIISLLKMNKYKDAIHVLKKLQISTNLILYYITKYIQKIN